MIGERLRNARIKKGYSQRALSMALNIGENEVYRYEKGKTNPSSEALEKIAKALEVSADYLLGLTDDPVAYMKIGDLSEFEARIIDAIRRGDSMLAIREIANHGTDIKATV